MPKCCANKRAPGFPHRSAGEPLFAYLLEVVETNFPDVKLKSWVSLANPHPKHLEVFANPSTRVAVLAIQANHLSVVTFEGKDYTLQGCLTMKGWATNALVYGFTEIVKAVSSTWCSSTFDEAVWGFYRVTRRGKQSIDRETREWINAQVAKALNKAEAK